MAKILMVIASPELTDETCKVLYSPLYNSFCVKGIAGSSMYQNDGKCNNANFWGIDKAKSNSFVPCYIVAVEKRLVKDGDKYVDTFGTVCEFNSKIDDARMQTVIIDMPENIERKILDDIFAGKITQNDNIDSYFTPKFPTTEDKLKEVLENVVKYCEDQAIYDKLTMYGDFYYKAKKLLQNMK